MDRSGVEADETGRRRLSRRGFVTSTGLTVLAGTAVSLRGTRARQIEVDIPVPATPGLEPVADAVSMGPTVASKAAELGFDTQRMFEFVRDNVRYEPYAGSLRGADGTLWSLGGNSADTSQLLASLLDEALVTYRFAVGPLAPDQIAALTAATMVTADDVLRHSAMSSIAAAEPRTFGQLAPPVEEIEIIPLTPEEEAEVTANQTAGQNLLDEAHTRAIDQVTLIDQALREAGITIPQAEEFTLPNLEIERHVWIQVADGPVWIDYVPTGIAGSASVPTETFDVLPEDLQHLVDIRLFAEELIGGELQRRELVRLYGHASGLVNVPVAMLAQPPGDFEAMGLTINQLFSGDISLVPYMYAGDIAVLADVPIVFGSSESTVFGALDDGTAEDGLGEGETLALWLDILQTSPGREPVHIERTLMDRIGAERRLHPLDFSDAATRSSIEPVKLVDFYDGTQTIDQLAAVHLLHTDLARLDLSYAVSDATSSEVYGAAGFNVPAMTTLRDTLRLTDEVPLGFQSVIGRPQFTLTSLSLVDGVDGSATQDVELGIDILHRDPHIVPLAGSTMEQSAQPAVLAGVLDQISEHQLIVAMESQDSGVTGGAVTVTRIFELAVEQSVPIACVSTSADLPVLELDAVSISLLERGLAEGFVAVTPVRPVTIDDGQRAGWWLIHPQTGETRDQLDSGKGGALLRIGSLSRIGWRPVEGKHFSTAVEDANLRQVSTNASKPFRRTLCGRIVNAVLGATMWIASGIALANGDVTGAIKQLSPAAKILEERQKLRDVAKAARNNGGASCG